MRRSHRTKLFVVITCVCLAGGTYLLLKSASEDSPNHFPISSKNETAQARKEPTDSKEPSQDVSDLGADFKKFHQTMGDQIANESMDKAIFEIEQRDPREFVRRSDHEINHALTRKLLTQDSLPTLYALLEDPAYRKYWSNVAKTICYLSDDPKSASVIIKYIRRSDDWKQGTPHETHLECVGKLEAITWLGFLGGEEVERVLMQAMTPDGAKELAKAWINGPLPVWATRPDEEIVGSIQGSAAIGIVHSQNQQGIQKAEALHETARAHCKQLDHLTMQFQKTARAMAIRDLIQSTGMEAYLDGLGTPGFYNSSIEPRALRYRNRDEISKQGRYRNRDGPRIDRKTMILDFPENKRGPSGSVSTIRFCAMDFRPMTRKRRGTRQYRLP